MRSTYFLSVLVIGLNNLQDNSEIRVFARDLQPICAVLIASRVWSSYIEQIGIISSVDTRIYSVCRT